MQIKTQLPRTLQMLFLKNCFTFSAFLYRNIKRITCFTNFLCFLLQLLLKKVYFASVFVLSDIIRLNSEVNKNKCGSVEGFIL